MTDLTQANGQALDENAKAVEAGLAMHLRVKSALEDARQVISLQESQLRQAAVEIESLRQFNNLMESRIESAILERDLAVDQRARLEGLIEVVEAAIERFKRPAAPIIREKPAEIAAN